MKYFLSLGTNVGNKKENLRRALFLLKKEGAKILRASSLYKTQPVDFYCQPWFLNQVVEIEADCSPHALLDLIKQIEEKMKRQPTVQNGPRRIDIDILLAEKTIIQTKKLIIPHPRMEIRNFVLVPLMEIAPEIMHPLLKEKIRDLWKKSQDCSIVKRIQRTTDYEWENSSKDKSQDY